MAKNQTLNIIFKKLKYPPLMPHNMLVHLLAVGAWGVD